MKITITRSFYLAGIMIAVLAVGMFIISGFEIDRKIRISGSFVYRNALPLTAGEEGTVEKILCQANDSVKQGDTILVLSNPDLEMEYNNSLSRLHILELELKKILDIKEQDFSLNFYDQNKLKKDYEQKSSELIFYQRELEEKKNLLTRNLVSGKEVDELNLKVHDLTREAENLKLTIEETDSKLKNLNTSSLLLYSLKAKEIEIEKAKFSFLTKRRQELCLTAKISGKILADSRLENLLYRQVKKGEQLADIVSFADINFIGYAKDADIIRIRPGQNAYFNVELFRGKNSITGKVKSIGYKPKIIDNTTYFPIEIEADRKEFFDRDKKLYLEAGVQGEGIVLTEENVPIFRLIMEKFLSKLDFLE